ncbi:carbohydrate binding domain-containing protein [Rubellicoccus peritrichatus]|uniref:Carbohydrate binding domain-containing protein n=1 Tax=Rubellicoccus peritrichatus TaxID=3080537 RepID=A0AAQ3LD88_9BACT|nr:carbohydrate binding domain-containing protein [Puniceicoccus sp. CR14]WOO43346.1 carbohydrate binding domain-containing protein [Puniceicoccus sp. CR14]
MNKTLLVCLSLVSTFSLNAGKHLLNTSFEDMDIVSEKAEHWGVWGPALVRVVDWEPTADGMAMIGYKHWEIPFGTSETSGIFQDTQGIETGETYEFSVYVNADNPDWGMHPEKIELRLETTLDSKQVHLATREFEVRDLIGDGWTRLSIESMASNEKLRALIIFHPSIDDNKGGALKIDKAQISKK